MTIVPNTWGAGQLFAFSGMEGPTSATSPMVAHTLGDRIGLRVFFEPAIELWCQGDRGRDPTRKYPRCMPAFDIVTGDAIRLAVAFTDGQSGTIAIAPTDQDTFAGTTLQRLRPHWSVGPDANRPLPAGEHIHTCDEGFAALVVQEQGEVVRFALAHDPSDATAAVAKARRGLETDLNGLIDRRKQWLAAIEPPPGLPEEYVPTYRKAVAIMKVNTCTGEGQIRHTWTTPDRWPHRWMWLHDTAYHAAGHVHHFPDLARSELAAVFDTQEKDGRIALFMRPDGNFPEISQSPILTWGVRQAYEASGDRDWLSDIYPKLKMYLNYFVAARGFQDTGLFRWAHSDESMDNNPRFDQGAEFGAIDLTCTLCREFEEAAFLAHEVGAGEDARGWLNAREDAAEAINNLLWHDALGQYGDLMPDGTVRVLSTCVTFLPLFAGIVPPDRAQRLHDLLHNPERFWTTVPVPTVAADEETFYPDMWRGPSWINMNHLICEGLQRSGFPDDADKLRRRSIDIVHKWCRHTGVIYEFYDCRDRVPPFMIDRKSRICYGGGFTNISDYHWTSSLFVAMCWRLFGERQ